MHDYKNKQEENKKKEEAILNFDLLREEGRSDKFFNDKISYLLGLQEKTGDKISDKNLLNFYYLQLLLRDLNMNLPKKLIKIFGNFQQPQILQ